MNSDVEGCLEGKKLGLTRPDGERYKMTIIRQEKAQTRPGSAGEE